MEENQAHDEPYVDKGAWGLIDLNDPDNNIELTPWRVSLTSEILD